MAGQVYKSIGSPCEPSSSTAGLREKRPSSSPVKRQSPKRIKVGTVNSETVSSTTIIEETRNSDHHDEETTSSFMSAASAVSRVSSVTSVPTSQNRILELEKKHVNELISLINASLKTAVKDKLKPDVYEKMKSDLVAIRDKSIKKLSYESTDEFLKDLERARKKWTTHKQRDIVSALKQAIDHAKKDINFSKMCVDCVTTYYVKDFRYPCRRPHTLVYAKLAKEPYWPAKVIHYEESTKRVIVKFFGTGHRIAKIAPGDCRLITKDYLWFDDEKHMKQLSRDKIKMAFDEAMNELTEHIIKVNNTFERRDKRIVFADPQRNKFNVKQLYLKGLYHDKDNEDIDDHGDCSDEEDGTESQPKTRFVDSEIDDWYEQASEFEVPIDSVDEVLKNYPSVVNDIYRICHELEIEIPSSVIEFAGRKKKMTTIELLRQYRPNLRPVRHRSHSPCQPLTIESSPEPQPSTSTHEIALEPDADICKLTSIP